MFEDKNQPPVQSDSLKCGMPFVRRLDMYVNLIGVTKAKAKKLERELACNAECSSEKLLLDEPIRTQPGDVLGRAPVAHAFARSILELDASQGLVVAVLGPWGHGKSSFINLMREEFEGFPEELKRSEDSEPTPGRTETKRALTVLDFNPWMFSGSDQLVNFFFTQIGEELKIENKRHFGKIADLLRQYGEFLKPASQIISFPGAKVVGETAAALVRMNAGRTNADRSLQEVKDDIIHALKRLESPIVVVIDDIDRLTKIEIREIFKLVRLTASFPNIIYLLAFDRERVEKALSEDDIPGRAYLEKIVQLDFDVPQAPKEMLQSHVIKKLNYILGPITSVLFNKRRWHDTYLTVIAPLFSNMRDVVRYAISSKRAIRELGDQIDLVDLLVMEAIRILRPQIFERLLKLQHDLVNPPIPILQEGAETEGPIDALLKEFPKDRFILQGLLNSIFPAAQDKNGERYAQHNSIWRLEHRIAHVDFLKLYLERVASDPLTTFRDSERVFTCLNDGVALKKYLTELDPEKLEDVISDLASFESKFTDDMIVPASVTLLNLIDTIPKEKQHNLFGREFPVYRVVRSVLFRVEGEKEREALVPQILEGIETYSSELFFIDDIIGYGKANENKIVSTVFAQQMRTEFIQKLQDAPPSTPSREWCAGRIYHAVQKETGKTPLRPSDDPALLQAVFHSLKSTAVSQDFPVTSIDHLDWDIIVQLFGSERKVRTALFNIREELGDHEVLRLVDRYLGGWRPEFFYAGQSQAKETKN